MNNMPFFSVVIPVYNSENYLIDCVNSVLEQTFSDYELILVDDESKDSSAKICDELHKKNPEQIHVLHQKNTGVYLAKRNGIKASKGKYIYVMDNDDLLLSESFFETIKKQIDETQCDLVVFNATNDLNTNKPLCNIPFKHHTLLMNDQLSLVYDEFLKTKNLHHIWMMVFRRELFDWEYEYTDKNRMLRDGPSLILPIISNAERILFLEDIFYYWRVQNQDSASKHYDVENFYYSIRSFHQRVLEYSNKWLYKSRQTDSLVHSNYMTDICIAAIKNRSISPSGISKKEFLKMLSNDDQFRSEYTLKNIDAYRKPVVLALYHKQYWFIIILSKIVGFIKQR